MKQKRSKNPKTTIDKPFSVSGLFDGIIDRCNLLITFGVVVLLCLIIFHDFILGRYYYLFYDIAMDSISTAFPGIYHAARYLRTEGFPLWSFSQGMGQNIMAASLADPFYWVVYLAGPSHAAYAIIWMEVSKILVTAAAFYHFLDLLKFNSLPKVIGTVLYCFSGFMIVGGQWWIFSTEACYLALLLWSFEKLYGENSWYFFPPVVALIAIHNPFELYTSSLVLFIYSIFRHVTSEQPKFRAFLSLVWKMIYLGALGVLISCASLVSNIQRIMESPRVSGDFSHFHKLSSIPVFALEKTEHYVTTLLRFFSNDMMGNAVNYSGWHNYLEAPLLYIGLLPLLLLPQIFVLFKKRKLIVCATLLLIILVPIILPYFRYAFFLFSGDYYRVFSLFAALIILILGLYVLKEVESDNCINTYVLIGTLLVLIAALYYPYQTSVTNIDIADGSPYPFSQNLQGMISLNPKIRFAVCILLCAYSAILYLYRHVEQRSFLKVLLLVVLMIEIGYMNTVSLKDRYTLSPSNIMSYSGGDTKDAVDFIHAIDEGFYRINIDAGLTPPIQFIYNKAKILDYYGTPSYDSFNQRYYIRFLEELGIIKKEQEAESRFSRGLVQHPLLWPFASIKYHIGKDSDMSVIQLGFRPIKRIGEATIYKNGNFMPLGYTFNHYIPIGKFGSLPNIQKSLVLQKAVVVEEPVDTEVASKLNELDEFILTQNNGSYTYFQDIAHRNQNTFHISRFSHNDIKGTIKLDTPQMLFFSIPYDRGWSAVIDNRKTRPQLTNIGFTGFLLGPGEHTLHLSYVPRYFFPSVVASALGLIIYLVLMVFHHKSKKICPTA